MHLRKRRHTVIECIPIEMGLFEEASMYFKVSISLSAIVCCLFALTLTSQSLW
jgi:hypothetical protein